MAGNEIDGPVCSTDGSCCGPDSPCCEDYAGPIEYRAAERSDLQSIRELLAQSQLPLEGVDECIENFIVAEASGSIVGSISIERHGNYGLLRSAAVSKPLRGRGIGTELVHRLLGDARVKDLEGVYLLTTTAEEYFSSLGFGKIDRSIVPPELGSSVEFQSACPSSATAMRLVSEMRS